MRVCEICATAGSRVCQPIRVHSESAAMRHIPYKHITSHHTSHHMTHHFVCPQAAYLFYPPPPTPPGPCLSAFAHAGMLALHFGGDLLPPGLVPPTWAACLQPSRFVKVCGAWDTATPPPPAAEQRGPVGCGVGGGELGEGRGGGGAKDKHACLCRGEDINGSRGALAGRPATVTAGRPARPGLRRPGGRGHTQPLHAVSLGRCGAQRGVQAQHASQAARPGPCCPTARVTAVAPMALALLLLLCVCCV